MLDHVGIPVSDFDRSKRFYERALSPLGYGLLMEPRHGIAGFGRSGKPDFWVFEGEPGDTVHVALAAADRAVVAAFHEAAIAAGGRDNGGQAPAPSRPTTRAPSCGPVRGGPLDGPGEVPAGSEARLGRL